MLIDMVLSSVRSSDGRHPEHALRAGNSVGWSRRRTIDVVLAMILVLTFAGCSGCLGSNKDSLVGEWKAPNATLSVSENGSWDLRLLRAERQVGRAGGDWSLVANGTYVLRGRVVEGRHDLVGANVPLGEIVEYKITLSTRGQLQLGGETFVKQH